MQTLFSDSDLTQKKKDEKKTGSMYVPLSENLRPESLKDVVGQEHLTGPTGILSRSLEVSKLGSMIFWGPPGTGKTTVAQLLAKEVTVHFEQLSAIFSGVLDLKKIFEKAKKNRSLGIQTLLFIDEIHRFNKSQQDCFLPVLEDGTIILIGATTENPSFSLNNALISRMRVLTFNRLDSKSLESLLQKVELRKEMALPLTAEARSLLIETANGDGRSLLLMLEDILHVSLEKHVKLTPEKLSEILQKRVVNYDKSGEEHYNLISALHKSIRGSDPDAALYYLCRMLEGGEDPLYLARRFVRMAVEDIGLADPQALTVTHAARESYELLGSPEGELALAQACIYLATAPKSNAVYRAFARAKVSASKSGNLSPPMSILNSPTALMKKLGYGKDYRYDHDQKDAFSGEDYFPLEIGRQRYYFPVERGFEREISKRLIWWERRRQERQNNLKE